MYYTLLLDYVLVSARPTLYFLSMKVTLLYYYYYLQFLFLFYFLIFYQWLWHFCVQLHRATRPGRLQTLLAVDVYEWQKLLMSSVMAETLGNLSLLIWCIACSFQWGNLQFSLKGSTASSKRGKTGHVVEWALWPYCAGFRLEIDSNDNDKFNYIALAKYRAHRALQKQIKYNDGIQ